MFVDIKLIKKKITVVKCFIIFFNSCPSSNGIDPIDFSLICIYHAVNRIYNSVKINKNIQNSNK